MHKAIVTGGTRGIGRAIAKAILAGGGQVAITGREQERVDEAVHTLGSEAGDFTRIWGAAVDVRNREGVDALVRDVSERFGGLNVLINNAGVGVFDEIASMSDADWATVMDTNVTGAFFCSRAALPELRRAGGGWVINIASLAGRNYFAGGGAYCASKAALIAFSEVLMQEVRYDNIRVSVIMPGSVATTFSGHSMSDTTWKLTGDDVAEVVMDLLRHPGRSLPSRVEIRPAKPRQS